MLTDVILDINCSVTVYKKVAKDFKEELKKELHLAKKERNLHQCGRLRIKSEDNFFAQIFSTGSDRVRSIRVVQYMV